MGFAALRVKTVTRKSIKTCFERKNENNYGAPSIRLHLRWKSNDSPKFASDYANEIGLKIAKKGQYYFRLDASNEWCRYMYAYGHHIPWNIQSGIGRANEQPASKCWKYIFKLTRAKANRIPSKWHRWRVKNCFESYVRRANVETFRTKNWIEANWIAKWCNHPPPVGELQTHSSFCSHFVCRSESFEC